jgi:hypothetical protein
MTNEALGANPFDWRLPLCAALGTCLVFLPFVLSSADFGEILYVCLAAPIVSIVLIVFAIRRKGRRRLSSLLMLIVYLAVSSILVENYAAVRDVARWMLWSSNYKSEMKRHPISHVGELGHVEWDDWGFAGAGETVEYIVFDPSDSLGAS